MMYREIGFIIDLDGTMYRGGQMVEAADVFIDRLQKRQIPYLFLTNNSSKAPEEVADHMKQMGIPARPDDVYTTAIAAAHYIRTNHPGASVHVIGEEGLREAIRQAGLKIVEDEQPDVVVQGIDRQFTYDKLARAVQYIRDGAVSIMTNPDLLLPNDDGFQPGAGSIGAAIQAASGQAPVVIGKPSSIIMKDAVERLGLPAERIWVVGDNAATDIKAGVNAGCRTALVLTGLTNRSNMKQLLSIASVTPDLVSEDLMSLMAELLDQSNSTT